MSKAKRNALLLLSVAGMLVFILVMSVSALDLSPGEPFSLGESEVTMPGVAEAVPGSDVLLWVVRGFLALAVIFVPIYIITSLFSRGGRRRLLVNLLIVLLLFWLLDYIENHPTSDDSAASEVMTNTDMGRPADSPPTPVFSEDEAPPWLATVVILIASLFGVGLLGFGVWIFQQRARQVPSPLESLAEAAQDTITSLQSGGDFKTAIVRCYFEMNQVIKQERGISRETTMTPREFETYLVSRGVPQGALETLTRLFEQVRYGNAPPRTDDEALAVNCLTEIVDSIKVAKMRP